MLAHLVSLMLATSPALGVDEDRPTLATCVAIADEAEAKLPGFREEADATVHALAACVRKVAAQAHPPRARRGHQKKP